jgi:hypothetical protein
MVDMSAIGAVSASLRLATDITKALIGVRDEAMIRERVIELQAAIIDAHQSVFEAQMTQSSLLNEVTVLKSKLAELEGWADERKRYALVDLGAGKFAYRVNDSARGGEPSHLLCAKCFHEEKKSILQTIGRATFECHACKSILSVSLGSHERDSYDSDYDIHGAP